MEDYDESIYKAIRQVMPYITESKDRDSASLVCRRWFQVESETRDNVTVSSCYSATPDHLSRRFSTLRSLTIKGKPRAAMFSRVPADWGGYASPWVNEISNSLKQLNSIHFKGMIVRDFDLDVLARARLHNLETLKLDRCFGFSSEGLLSITTHCRKIKVLFVKGCLLREIDGKWLHEIALHNTSLEVLNWHMAKFDKVNPQDLVTIARKCRYLVSVKLGHFNTSKLHEFFEAAANLEEFCGGSILELRNPEKYKNLCLPPKLCRLGLFLKHIDDIPILLNFASRIRKLDLVYACFLLDDYSTVFQNCPNLEVLDDDESFDPQVL